MAHVLRGIIHGRTVELQSDPGLPDGQEVDVKLSTPPQQRTGEGIVRSDGILVDDAEWDQIMEEIHQQRKLERRPQLDGWDEE